jgi:hypothetical protein
MDRNVTTNHKNNMNYLVAISSIRDVRAIRGLFSFGTGRKKRACGLTQMGADRKKKARELT